MLYLFAPVFVLVFLPSTIQTFLGRLFCIAAPSTGISSPVILHNIGFPLFVSELKL